MKFRTEINIPVSTTSIGYSTHLLSLGSCFAQSIGDKLRESKFRAVVNPVGVLFNPLSICSALSRFAEQRLVEESELEQSREGWFHFDFHGSLSDINSEGALWKINEAVLNGSAALAAADVVIITLGTSWVYELKESGKVVANCHKEPAKRFVRRMMSVAEIVSALSEQIECYPNKRFIFSVSPVRHLLDGLAENLLSKSTLRVAVSELAARFDNVEYFPAFEVMIDDLRDYRFYADDMLHPSNQAIDYIWSKFVDSYLSVDSRHTMDVVASVVRAAAHRPFNASSDSYLEFCRKQLDTINENQDIDFGKESAFFMSKLDNIL